jgi:gliding motility-associated-like protein
VLSKPKPNLGIDTVLCKGDTLMISPGQFDTYLWQDGSVKNNYVVKQGGLYSVRVTNVCGVANDEKYVREDPCEIYFPSAFTPNNDGLNDVFRMLNAYNKVTDFHLRIYNRWGQMIFESKDPAKGWTASSNNIPDGIGIYVWQCDFKRSGIHRYMKGTVTLIR